MIVFYIVILGITPVMMIVLGLIMKNHPPKKINWLYGYRTRRSMRNIETWQFAHFYLGDIWVRVGLVLLLISLLGSVVQSEILLPYIIVSQIVCVLIPLVFTEVALKRKFDNQEDDYE